MHHRVTRRSAPHRRAHRRAPRARLTRALLVMGAALSGTTLVPSAAHAQSRAELERVLHSKVLPNGLEVIVVENHGVPLATVEVNVRNGAFTQTPDYAGLAHLYEHMFFRANEQYPEPGDFLDRASSLGAVFNGTTQEERVNYYLTVPADSLEGAMRFLDAALQKPLFLPQEMSTEREVVIGEYDRAESSPFFDFENAMTRALYPGNFSRKNTIGDRQVVQTATPAMMRTIQHRYYVPNNSVLVVTGDVDPERVFAMAQRIYGDWARQPDPFVANPIPPIPALTGDSAIIMEKPVSAVTVMLQWQGPSIGKDRDATYAADVFSDILNNPGSVFQQRLVDSGLWQAVGVNYYTLNQKGPITISGQTTPDKLRAALAALDAEIVKLGDPRYYSDEALENAKASRTVGSAQGAERASGLAHTVGFWWSVADVDYFLGYVDNMGHQTAGDLAQYARRYIIGQPRVAGVLLSPQARRQSGITKQDLLRSGRIQ